MMPVPTTTASARVGAAGQLVVHLEGGVEGDHQRAHEADEDVEVEPALDVAEAGEGAGALADRVEEVGQHEGGGDDAHAVPPRPRRAERLVQRRELPLQAARAGSSPTPSTTGRPATATPRQRVEDSQREEPPPLPLAAGGARAPARRGQGGPGAGVPRWPGASPWKRRMETPALARNSMGSSPPMQTMTKSLGSRMALPPALEPHRGPSRPRSPARAAAPGSCPAADQPGDALAVGLAAAGELGVAVGDGHLGVRLGGQLARRPRPPSRRRPPPAPGPPGTAPGR